MSSLSPAQIYQYATGAGFTSAEAVTATAVALAASGGNSTDRNNNPPKEDSRGLWQINVLAHPQFASWNLYDPATNAKAAYAVSNGGKNFGPWTEYAASSAYPQNTDAYSKFLDTASKAELQAATGSGIVGGVVSGGGGIINDIIEGAKTVIGAGTKTLSGIEEVGQFFAQLGTDLFDPSWWKRLGIGAIGLTMVAVGIHVILDDGTSGTAGGAAGVGAGVGAARGAGESAGGIGAELAETAAAV